MTLLFTLQLFQSTHFENGKEPSNLFQDYAFRLLLHKKNIFNSIISEIADMSEKNKIIKYSQESKKIRVFDITSIRQLWKLNTLRQ